MNCCNLSTIAYALSLKISTASWGYLQHWMISHQRNCLNFHILVLPLIQWHLLHLSIKIIVVAILFIYRNEFIWCNFNSQFYYRGHTTKYNIQISFNAFYSQVVLQVNSISIYSIKSFTLLIKEKILCDRNNFWLYTQLLGFKQYARNSKVMDLFQHYISNARVLISDNIILDCW